MKKSPMKVGPEARVGVQLRTWFRHASSRDTHGSECEKSSGISGELGEFHGSCARSTIPCQAVLKAFMVADASERASRENPPGSPKAIG